jgi:hypothetical protein
VDDEEYVDRIAEASAALLKAGRLKAIPDFRKTVTNHVASLKTLPVSGKKIGPADLCERLRESTFTIGSYYHCPECSGWHINTGAGFVIASNGLLSTCCHVVLDQDEKIKESYLIAADAEGKVYPVQSVVAADTEADTCVIKIEADHLTPLPVRPGVRVGEPVFCLSHPGGYHFMFTQGMVARINRHRDEALDSNGKTNGTLTRPLLFVNVTAEYAPGSSGAAIVDEFGNVVAQVASITDACEAPPNDLAPPPAPPSADQKRQSDESPLTTFPSVPVRFCTAAEELLRITGGQNDGELKMQPVPQLTRGRGKHKKEP